MADNEFADLFELWWANQLNKLPKDFRGELFLDTEKATKLADKRSSSLIRRWIDAGHIRAIPNGKTWRVYVPSLKAYLHEKWMSAQ